MGEMFPHLVKVGGIYMEKVVSCKSCGKKLQPEDKFIHSSKTYCKDCYDKVVQEANDYKQLMEFICTNYEIESPTGLILKQIKDMKTNFGWSYAAMTYTLWYCKEIVEKPLIEKYGVYLIKNYYNEAKAYYLQQEKLKEQLEELKDIEIKTKVVKKVTKEDNSNKSNSSLIDLESLIRG